VYLRSVLWRNLCWQMPCCCCCCCCCWWWWWWWCCRYVYVWLCRCLCAADI